MTPWDPPTAAERGAAKDPKDIDGVGVELGFWSIYRRDSSTPDGMLSLEVMPGAAALQAFRCAPALSMQHAEFDSEPGHAREARAKPKNAPEISHLTPKHQAKDSYTPDTKKPKNSPKILPHPTPRNTPPPKKKLLIVSHSTPKVGNRSANIFPVLALASSSGCSVASAIMRWTLDAIGAEANKPKGNKATPSVVPPLPRRPCRARSSRLSSPSSPSTQT
jgi:hypothetical protein